MVQQLTVFLENSPGRLARMTRTLGDAGVNMRALMVADTAEFGVVRIICDRPEVAKHSLESAGFSVSVTEVIAAAIPDRPGGLADVLEVLDAEGLNVEYAYCFVDPDGGGAVDIFRVGRMADAIRALEDADIRVVHADEI